MIFCEDCEHLCSDWSGKEPRCDAVGPSKPTWYDESCDPRIVNKKNDCTHFDEKRIYNSGGSVL